ncbi:S8 family serine peptidase [Staphylococcus aureus]
MITVAVIDTGVDIYHNKLYKYINLNLSKSFVDESLTDKNGHGTAITGIILYNEKFKESLKNVQLVICKITNQLTFEVEKFIEALEYAISIGVHIINLSLSIKIYNATQRQMGPDKSTYSKCI